MNYRVLLVDDHGIIRAGIKRMLPPDLEVVAEAGTAKAAIRLCVQHAKVDIAVIDYDLPDMSGLDLVTEFRKYCPNTPCLILSSVVNDVLVKMAIQAGALGFVLKTDDANDLIEAIRNIAAGGTYLSGKPRATLMRLLRESEAVSQDKSGCSLGMRELQVVRLTAQGKSSKEIATMLGLEVSTVRVHKKNIFRKLEAHSVQEMIVAAHKRGIVIDDRPPVGAETLLH